MVRAGETGGVLDEVLNRVADHFESEQKLKGKIKSAMTYPIAMGGLVLVVLAAMMIFVVPTFEKMFEDMGGKLPFMTQLLVNASDFVAGWGGVAVLVLTVAAVMTFKWWSKGPGKRVWDATKLNMPVFGPLIRKSPSRSSRVPSGPWFRPASRFCRHSTSSRTRPATRSSLMP